MPGGAGGGGGVNPTSMAQNDTHVALIILTTQMWGGGGKYWSKKLFRAKFCVPMPLGANIRSYTKQRARHGTPFLQPPPLLRRASMSAPPPPPQSNFQVALLFTGRLRPRQQQSPNCELHGHLPQICKRLSRRFLILAVYGHSMLCSSHAFETSTSIMEHDMHDVPPFES